MSDQTPNSFDERRPAPRIALNLDIEFRRSYARTADNGQLRNISLTGAFLEREGHGLKQNDKLNIEFNVGGRTRKIAAAIIWVTDVGCGVKFMPQNNRDVQIVDDLMYFVETKRETSHDVLNNIFKRVA